MFLICRHLLAKQFLNYLWLLPKPCSANATARLMLSLGAPLLINLKMRKQNLMFKLILSLSLSLILPRSSVSQVKKIKIKIPQLEFLYPVLKTQFPEVLLFSSEIITLSKELIIYLQQLIWHTIFKMYLILGV